MVSPFGVVGWERNQGEVKKRRGKKMRCIIPHEVRSANSFSPSGASLWGGEEQGGS